MSNGAISLASQKQPTVALSTAEAEHIAFCIATQESVWLRQLKKDLQIDCSSPTTIHEDNQRTIAMSKTLFYISEQSISILNYILFWKKFKIKQSS